MSGRFVRASKYRHVFGRSSRKEQCYDNLRISRNAWDTNLVKANSLYLSINWEASGGGAFAVIPLQEKGKLPEQLPLFRGHTSVVLDTDWSPFDDHLIASASDDAKVFLWRVPTDFVVRTDDEEPKDVSPISQLSGHSRKVGHVLFNPAAENILASTSGDFTIRIWDVEHSKASLSFKQGDLTQSLSWNANGSLLVTTSRDKRLRVWDVRQKRAAQEVPGHAGAKNSRVVWMGKHDRVASTGFSKMSDRQMGLWDIRDAKEPIGGFYTLDSISGVCMPFWDDGTQCLYLAGKGDGNIRYFEYQNDKFEFLSEYKSADPQRGIGFLPKRAVNLHDNEVMRAFKTVNDSYIEPISFIVPRRAEVFQDDIYPPTVGTKAAVSASEWLDGQDGLPPKIDLENVYNGEEPAEILPGSIKKDPPFPVNEEKKETKSASQVNEEKKEMTPVSTALREHPKTLNETKNSISAMASKFADDDNDDNDKDEDDTAERDSSFDDPVKSPPQRIMNLPVKAEPLKGVTLNESVPAKDLVNLTESDSPNKTAKPAVDILEREIREEKVESTAPNEQRSAPSRSNSIVSSSSSETIRTFLKRLSSQLEEQHRRLEKLTAEVDGVRTTVVDLSQTLLDRDMENEKDERIRQLEQELEQSRS